MWSIYLGVIVQGVLTGLVYGLMALGLSVIFGVVRVVNFAHGEFAVVAMYAAYVLFTVFKLDPLVALVPVAAGFFVIGYTLQATLINPFVGRPEHQQFIVLVGVGLIITNLLLMGFGPDARPVNLPYGFDSYAVGPLFLDKPRVLAAAAAIVIAAGLFWFFRRTPTGTAIRACADNLVGAEVVGTRRETPLCSDLRAGARLRRGGGRAARHHRGSDAGARAGLHAARFHHRDHRRHGVDGGCPCGRHPDWGLGGAGRLPVRAVDEEHVLVRALDRRAGAAAPGAVGTAGLTVLWRDLTARGRVALALALGVLLALPLMADRYLISVVTLVFYFAYVGQAWNLMMGYAGQLSLGHALYVGLGGYVAALLWLDFGVGPWLGVFAAVAVAASFGAVIGWLGFRFRIAGVYFALLTIAFAEFTRIGFDNMSFTGGAAGLFLPFEQKRLGEWWNLRGGQVFFYYLALMLAAGAVVATALLARSRLGYQWLAVREDETAARAVGIDAFRVKLAAVVISSAMTAVGGVFYAFYNNSLFPAQVFDMSRSIELILAPIVGGLGTVFGPVIGAFILTPLGEGLIAVTKYFGVDLPGLKAVFYGAVLIAITIAMPDGVWPRLCALFGLKGRAP